MFLRSWLYTKRSAAKRSYIIYFERTESSQRSSNCSSSFRFNRGPIAQLTVQPKAWASTDLANRYAAKTDHSYLSPFRPLFLKEICVVLYHVAGKRHAVRGDAQGANSCDTRNPTNDFTMPFNTYICMCYICRRLDVTTMASLGCPLNNTAQFGRLGYAWGYESKCWFHSQLTPNISFNTLCNSKQL